MKVPCSTTKWCVMTLKERLKQFKLFYFCLYKLRNLRESKSILREQGRFVDIAAEKVVVTSEDTATVFSLLRERLGQRGLVWPPTHAGRPLHILYASLPGNWELHNIPPELKKLGNVTCFFIKEQEISLDAGWPAVRQRVDALLPSFVQRIHEESPVDMVLSYLSGAQVSPITIEKINQMGIPTFSFHLDDRRFFYGYKYDGQWSGPAAVCRAYDLNLTNARSSLIKYRCEEANALFWPEGANPEYFRPLDVQYQYDVTFCGARYGQRPLLVEYLRREGIKVDCFGKEWEHGYQHNEAFVKVFNSSRINLGFGFVTDSNDQCLKGRDFEIPACGAVYLTSHNEDIARVYRIGTEIETYKSYSDCAEKIRVLLGDKERCDRMRMAARRAVLTRHTWALRIQQLLDCTGVPEA